MQRVLRIMGYVLFISSNPWRDHCLLLLLKVPEHHLQGKIRPWFARKKRYLKNNEWPSLGKKITNSTLLVSLSLHGRITKELNKSSKEQGNELIVFIRHPRCSNSKPLENILGNPHDSTHFWSTLCLILTCEPQLYRCHMPVWYLTYCWVSESFWHQLSDSPHHNQGTFVDRKKRCLLLRTSLSILVLIFTTRWGLKCHAYPIPVMTISEPPNQNRGTSKPTARLIFRSQKSNVGLRRSI